MRAFHVKIRQSECGCWQGTPNFSKQKRSKPISEIILAKARDEKILQTKLQRHPEMDALFYF
jgi:hypothetical protein